MSSSSSLVKKSEITDHKMNRYSSKEDIDPLEELNRQLSELVIPHFSKERAPSPSVVQRSSQAEKASILRSDTFSLAPGSLHPGLSLAPSQQFLQAPPAPKKQPEIEADSLGRKDPIKGLPVNKERAKTRKNYFKSLGDIATLHLKKEVTLEARSKYEIDCYTGLAKLNVAVALEYGQKANYEEGAVSIFHAFRFYDQAVVASLKVKDKESYEKQLKDCHEDCMRALKNLLHLIEEASLNEDQVSPRMDSFLVDISNRLPS